MSAPATTATVIAVGLGSGSYRTGSPSSMRNPFVRTNDAPANSTKASSIQAGVNDRVTTSTAASSNGITSVPRAAAAPAAPMTAPTAPDGADLPINARSAPLAKPSHAPIAVSAGTVSHHRPGAAATTRQRTAATV
jgi:hypothetical protein